MWAELTPFDKGAVVFAPLRAIVSVSVQRDCLLLLSPLDLATVIARSDTLLLKTKPVRDA